MSSWRSKQREDRGNNLPSNEGSERAHQRPLASIMKSTAAAKIKSSPCIQQWVPSFGGPFFPHNPKILIPSWPAKYLEMTLLPPLPYAPQNNAGDLLPAHSSVVFHWQLSLTQNTQKMPIVFILEVLGHNWASRALNTGEAHPSRREFCHGTG